MQGQLLPVVAGYPVAVLYARRDSVYKHLGSDVFDIDRDARSYHGPQPVLPKHLREATPPSFAVWLLDLAARCKAPR